MSRRSEAPVALLVPAVLGAALVVVPIAGLLWEAPWGDLLSSLTSAESRAALRLSLLCSLWATALAIVLGVPLAWVFARLEFPGRRLLRACTLMPLVLPPVAGGTALLLTFGRRGVVGQYLDDWFGVRFPFTTAGVVLAETFVAMPFLVLTAEAGFRAVDRRYEDAARSLGASRFTVFRRVTVRLAMPSIIAGAVLCWARALGEFGATITFAGNFGGVTRTVPLAVFVELQAGALDAAVALSVVMLVVSITVIVALRERWLGAP